MSFRLTCSSLKCQPLPGRRALLRSAAAMATAGALGALTLLSQPRLSWAATLTQEQRDRMTPGSMYHLRGGRVEFLG